MKRFFKSPLLLVGILSVVNLVLDFGFSRYLNHYPKLMYNAWINIIHDSIDADYKLIKEQEPFSLLELYLPMFIYYRHGVMNVLEDIYNKDCWYKGYYWGRPQE